MTEFNFDITEEIGEISKNDKGYSKEVNLISYNGAKPKIDIRNWSTDEDDNKKMGKGITLTEDEAIKLMEILNEYFYEDDNEEN